MSEEIDERGTGKFAEGIFFELRGDTYSFLPISGIIKRNQAIPKVSWALFYTLDEDNFGKCN